MVRPWRFLEHAFVLDRLSTIPRVAPCVPTGPCRPRGWWLCMTATTSDTPLEECSDLPALPTNALSVSFFNVPTAALMRWMVGEPTEQQKEDMAQVLSGQQNHSTIGSPFKSVVFVILFIAGLLMSLTIPALAILMFLWRRKKEASYAPHDDVTFFLLSVVLIAVSVLTGLFALILISNNEKVTEKPSEIANRFGGFQSTLPFGREWSPTGLVWPAVAQLIPWPSVKTRRDPRAEKRAPRMSLWKFGIMFVS
ncbi:hypothetical protein Y032_0047g1464 [Ancylostoma ceylanicum]|nr:hypothetical protein Y032_0047g1464 [Ancylostoma ceylanicum]